ncbi:MAG: type II toxin-antitoxin system PemK/MazF family toxin [Deltaproteobacteria bacterium]|jgi:mRNA interferase MazF|nr:type II toxin-antitoxin system PemK/MazF family toxin [Deltaproteobacteria bacterium]MBW2554252.1 type II toxin-antitoxin system PemK/MazF family toxin [Deltaproteobacteria bacterium]
MARFVKGDVVVVPFPFSDLTQAKRRPALVLAELTGDDVILCQITSQNVKDSYSISLNVLDFESGNLNKKSNIRPNRIFTADQKILLYKAGHLKKEKIEETIERLIEILNK